MLPLMLDAARLRLLLVGSGKAAFRRLVWLDEAGAADLAIHAEAPSPELARAAGDRLVARLPTGPELAAARLVFISERDAPYARSLAATARAVGALVHVEDAPELSDLHVPAVLRRGDLAIAVSTAGASPGLAVQVKRFLGRLFGPEWRWRLDDLAALRRAWLAGGADSKTVARRTEEWIARQGWLPMDAPSGKAATPADDLPARLVARH